MNKKLIDETLEAMLKSVAPEAEDKIVDNILNELNDEDDIEFSDTHVKKMQKLFKKERNKLVFKNLCIYSKYTAVVFLAILTVFGLSVVTVSAWRVKFLNFIVETRDTHSDIKFSENTTGSSYILNDINLGYIPDGFTLEQQELGDNRILLSFVNENSYFRFVRANTTMSTQIDTEDSYTKKLLIDSREAFFSLKDNVGILVWHDDDFVYRLTGNIDEKEMILIAENKK